MAPARCAVPPGTSPYRPYLANRDSIFFKGQFRVVTANARKLAGRMFARIAGRPTKRREIDIAPNRRARSDISYPPLKAGTARRAAAVAPATVTVDVVFLPG